MKTTMPLSTPVLIAVMIFFSVFLSNKLIAQYTIGSHDIVLNGGTTAMSVAWHPGNQRYYTSSGGGALSPMHSFNASGTLLSGPTSHNFDNRGLWYNPDNQRIEGSHYNTGQRGYYPLTSGTPDGHVVTSGYGSGTPSGQSGGTLNTSNGEVLFYSGGSLFYRYSMTSGQLGTGSITVPSGASFNITHMIYTGITNNEVGFYDHGNKRIYLYSINGGSYTSYYNLPSGAPTNSSYGFAYANGRVFLSSNGTWYGYPMNATCVTPGIPTGLTASVTGTSTANLFWTASSPSGSPTVAYSWEVYISGGSYVTGSSTESTSASVSGLSANTSYYFRVNASTSCNNTSSSWSANSSNFATLPSDPTSVSTTSSVICNGESTTLTANGAQGTVYWYTGSCGGAPTSPATGNTLIVSPSVTTTYYARNYDNSQYSIGCASVEITVNPLLQYRTAQTGNWTTPDSWQQYNGSSWVAATSYPGQMTNSCSNPLATIRTAHQMEIQSGSNIDIPNLKIEATGKLTIEPGGKIFVQDQLQLDESAGEAIVVGTSTPPPFTCGTSQVTFTYNGSTVTYGTVLGANNRCWLDRNLGATQVAASSTDAASYGDLFQWGRAADGHQIRTSGTISTNATTAVPNNGNSWDGLFIMETAYPFDWLSPQNSNLWQGVNGTNNHCPSGFRLPTEAEWNTERSSWTENNSAGAFAFPLKLPAAGGRNLEGLLYSVGSFGEYWSSSVSGIYARNSFFSPSNAQADDGVRARGYSVRCIKDE